MSMPHCKCDCRKEEAARHPPEVARLLGEHIGHSEPPPIEEYSPPMEGPGFERPGFAAVVEARRRQMESMPVRKYPASEFRTLDRFRTDLLKEITRFCLTDASIADKLGCPPEHVAKMMSHPETWTVGQAATLCHAVGATIEVKLLPPEAYLKPAADTEA